MGLCINIASFFYIDKKIENINELNCIAKIISIKEEKEYTNKYVVKVIKSNFNNNLKNIKLILYTSKEENYLPGDIVLITGTFSIPDKKRNYGGFDYNKYLKQSRIFGTVKAEECKRLFVKKDISSLLENLRYQFLIKLEDLYDDENSEFLKSLLFGKKDGLSENIEESFRNSSLSHILAISGMHVTYVIIGINFIFHKLIKNKKLRNNILIFCIIFFSFITGNSVSGVRACIMGAMKFIANNFERRNNFYFSLIYSLIIIILFNPYNIYNIGLWLSYLGSLGIVCFSSFLKKYISKKINFNSKLKFRKIKEYIIENFVVSLSAQILIFPIMIYVFNTFSVSFFISNILVSFFIGPVLILGYISLILSFIKFPLFKFIVNIENILIAIVIKIADICSKIPFSQIYVITPSILKIVMYYLIIFSLVFFSYKKRFYFIKICFNKSFKKKEVIKLKNLILFKLNKFLNRLNREKSNNCGFRKRLSFKILLLLFIIISLIFLLVNLNGKEELVINFIDVGQGDCTYVKMPNGKNIIIDGGEGNSGKYDYGENVVLPYLLDKGVKKIDYLIISHADSDHIGGLFYIIEKLKVDTIFIGIQPQISEQYVELLRLAKDKNIKIVNLKAGDKLKIDEVHLNVLWPVENRFIEENALNNNSLVFKLCYKNFSMLFTGDIEEIAENELLKVYETNLKILNSTILKVAHHGSKTSSTSEFIDSVSPRIALIGVGKNNKFGHPNDSVIKNLEKNNIKIYRTDINGEINIIIKNGKIKIETMY